MERLTRKEDGIAYYPYCFKEETCDGLGASSKCDDCNFSTAVCEKLAHYEDLEEQGLLLKLPCKVGDKVYQVLESIRVFEVTAIGVYDNRIVICTENWETGLGFSFDLKQIGKRYFLTKEEAEAKLKELENE